MLPRRQLALTDGLLFFLFLTWQLVAFTGEHGEHSSYGFLWASSTSSESLPLEQDILAVPQKRHIVAVASTSGFHFDVYTLERVMVRSPTGGSVQVYASWDFPHKFKMIVDERGIYHGVNKKSEELIPAINANMGDGGIDLIILGTCEVDSWQRAFGCLGRKRCRPQVSNRLHSAQYRGEHHIFILLEPESDSGVVSKTCHPHPRDRGARCDHLQTVFLMNADSDDSIPVDVHVPVLDIDVTVYHNPRVLSDAVIQGTFSASRRDYIQIFAELKEALPLDPKV